MASVYFVGPYPPILCGIGDYTAFLSGGDQRREGGVLSFDVSRYGTPVLDTPGPQPGHIWYGIPDRHSYRAETIQRGLRELGAGRDVVLWFQHEFGIWPHRIQFVNMLKGLGVAKVVTLHTLHFQSAETPSGLRREQYDFLRTLLPYVDAITVFSRGVRAAVVAAFPEYAPRIHVIKHGIHSYPETSRLTRGEARQKLNDYLLFDSDLDHATKGELHRQAILTDPETAVVGQTGFLSPSKGSQLLYAVRGSLQAAIPQRRIAAIRIGKPRDRIQEAYAERLARLGDGRPNFLLRVWLPQSMLPVAQRAFDINFYWPDECTQSGVLAHALGAGAVVAGRDLEGVGETMRDAGAIADTSLPRLTLKMGDVLLDPDLAARISERALDYAAGLSWQYQAVRHRAVAASVLHPARDLGGSPLPLSPLAAPAWV